MISTIVDGSTGKPGVDYLCRLCCVLLAEHFLIAAGSAAFVDFISSSPMTKHNPRLLLVANPVAGRGRVATQISGIQNRFLALGFEVKTIFTSGVNDHAKLRLPLNPAESIVAVGGDGTVNTVLHSLLAAADGRSAKDLPAVGVIPFGTGNAMVPAFGIPRNISAAIRTIQAGRTRDVDVGLVARDGVLQRVFLLWLGAGFDGVLMHTVAETRTGTLGLARLLGRIPAAFIRIWKYPFHEIEVALDDQPAFTCRSAMIANVGHLPLHANVARFADASDGALEIITTSNDRLWAWTRMALAALRHRLDDAKGVNYLRGTRVRLRASGSVPVHIDGDAAGTLPLEVQIKPRAIRLIVPDSA